MAHDIMLYIQPAYNCMTKSIEYAEVLIRRYRKIEGVKQILRYVSKCGIEEYFDLEILTEVCKYMQGKDLPYPLGINLCATTIANKGSIDKIYNIMKEYNIGCNDIIIEINESTDFDNDNVYENVSQLHSLGIKVALDDFGVEKANLFSLIHYKFDILKVDKSFIGHEREESKREILSVIHELCTKFHMKPIIEGIEDRKQLSNISNLGYTVVQGYLYSKPIPLEEFMWA